MLSLGQEGHSVPGTLPGRSLAGGAGEGRKAGEEEEEKGWRPGRCPRLAGPGGTDLGGLAPGVGSCVLGSVQRAERT